MSLSVNDVKCSTNNYIYLIREREFIRTGEDVYKVGKTTQPPNKRLCGYPKHSEVILFLKVNNCHVTEKLILSQMKELFTHETDLGNEYFRGSSGDMVKTICDVNTTCLATDTKVCHACNGTGTSYWSDDVYGPCMECSCIDCSNITDRCTCNKYRLQHTTDTGGWDNVYFTSGKHLLKGAVVVWQENETSTHVKIFVNNKEIKFSTPDIHIKTLLDMSKYPKELRIPPGWNHMKFVGKVKKIEFNHIESISYDFRRLFPYCIEVNKDTNEQLFINREYLYIGHATKCNPYDWERYERINLYKDDSKPWIHIDFWNKYVDKYSEMSSYSLCNFIC
jgi:hypothetical protein